MGRQDPLAAMSVLLGPFVMFGAILAVLGVAVSANAQSDNEATGDNAKAKPARFAYYSEVSTNRIKRASRSNLMASPIIGSSSWKIRRRFVIELHNADFRLGNEQAGSQNIGIVSENPQWQDHPKQIAHGGNSWEPAMLSSGRTGKGR